MKNYFSFYLIFGVLVCALMAYSGKKGLSYTDLFSSGKWGPAGRSSYHK